MPEGLSASEVGKEISEYRELGEHERDDQATAGHDGSRQWVSTAEAVVLAIVALLAAWSGYSAAKWDTDSSLSLAKASSTRTKASLAQIQATQIRTLDAVAFTAATTAYLGVLMQRGSLGPAAVAGFGALCRWPASAHTRCASCRAPHASPLEINEPFGHADLAAIAEIPRGRLLASL